MIAYLCFFLLSEYVWISRHAAIYDLAFSAEGSRLAVIRYDATAPYSMQRHRAWHAETTIAVAEMQPPYSVTYLGPSVGLDCLAVPNYGTFTLRVRQGNMIYFVNNDAALAMLDARTGAIVVYNFALKQAQRLESLGEHSKLCVAEDGSSLVRFRSDGVAVYSIGKCSLAMRPPLADANAMSGECPLAVSVTRDLAVTLDANKVQVWKLSTGALNCSIGTSPCRGTPYDVAVGWNRDRIALATTAGNSAIFSMDGEYIAGLTSSDSICRIVLSEQCDQVALLNRGKVEAYSLTTGRFIGGPGAHTEIVHSMAYSPDGKILAVGFQTYVELWNTGTWKSAGTFVVQPGNRR